MGIDWKRKLSSRKFWAALAGLAGAVAVVLGAGNDTIESVSAVISASGVLIAYILGESLIDAAADGTKQ
ncbi:MAG: hypothetical protein MJ102_06440 [Clostridia bacterium]|nr:hypothetical protein [Clostridia bacterium]